MGALMGARTSPAMLRARELIDGDPAKGVPGVSAYAAAKEAGITQAAISKSKWWKDRQARLAAQK